MHHTSFIDRPFHVQILTGIVLVLFSLTFLRFVAFTFQEEPSTGLTLVATVDETSAPASDVQLMKAERELKEAIHRLAWSQRKGKYAWCGHDEGHDGFEVARQNLLQAKRRLLRLQEEQRQAATIEQELRLRAEQFPADDAQIIDRLGLDSVPLPIMH